jgi:hypothetical protein
MHPGEEVFSVQSVLRLHNEDQQTAVSGVGVGCEMATSLRGHEPRSKGTFTVGRCYLAKHWRTWLRTPAFLWQWFVKCSNELCVKLSNKSINPHPIYSQSIMWQTHHSNMNEHFQYKRLSLLYHCKHLIGTNYSNVLIIIISIYYYIMFLDMQRTTSVSEDINCLCLNTIVQQKLEVQTTLSFKFWWNN